MEDYEYQSPETESQTQSDETFSLQPDNAPDEEPTQGVEPPSKEEPQSSQELTQIQQLIRDLEDQKQAFDELNVQDAYAKHLRAVYENDPFTALDMMLDKAKSDIVKLMDSRIAESINQSSALKADLEALSSTNRDILPHFMDETKILLEHGFSREEVLSLITKFQEKSRNASTNKRNAVHNMRLQSTMETDSEPADPAYHEKEFQRVLARSKNIAEMFASLRKLNAKSAKSTYK